MVDRQHTVPVVPYPSPAPTSPLDPDSLEICQNPQNHAFDGLPAPLARRLPVSSPGTSNPKFQMVPSTVQPASRFPVSKRKRTNPQSQPGTPGAQSPPKLQAPKRRKFNPQYQTGLPTTAQPAPTQPVSTPIPIDPRLLALSASQATPGGVPSQRKSRISYRRLVEGLFEFGVDVYLLKRSHLDQLKSLETREARHTLCWKWRMITVAMPDMLQTRGFDVSGFRFEDFEHFYNHTFIRMDPPPRFPNPHQPETPSSSNAETRRPIESANEMGAQEFEAELLESAEQYQMEWPEGWS